MSDETRRAAERYLKANDLAREGEERRLLDYAVRLMEASLQGDRGRTMSWLGEEAAEAVLKARATIREALEPTVSLLDEPADVLTPDQIKGL